MAVKAEFMVELKSALKKLNNDEIANFGPGTPKPRKETSFGGVSEIEIDTDPLEGNSVVSPRSGRDFNLGSNTMPSILKRDVPNHVASPQIWSKTLNPKHKIDLYQELNNVLKQRNEDTSCKSSIHWEEVEKHKTGKTLMYVGSTPPRSPEISAFDKEDVLYENVKMYRRVTEARQLPVESGNDGSRKDYGSPPPSGTAETDGDVTQHTFPTQAAVLRHQRQPHPQPPSVPAAPVISQPHAHEQPPTILKHLTGQVADRTDQNHMTHHVTNSKSDHNHVIDHVTIKNDYSHVTIGKNDHVTDHVTNTLNDHSHVRNHVTNNSYDHSHVTNTKDDSSHVTDHLSNDEQIKENKRDQEHEINRENIIEALSHVLNLRHGKSEGNDSQHDLHCVKLGDVDYQSNHVTSHVTDHVNDDETDIIIDEAFGLVTDHDFDNMTERFEEGSHRTTGNESRDINIDYKTNAPPIPIPIPPPLPDFCRKNVQTPCTKVEGNGQKSYENSTMKIMSASESDAKRGLSSSSSCPVSGTLPSDTPIPPPRRKRSGSSACKKGANSSPSPPSPTAMNPPCNQSPSPPRPSRAPLADTTAPRKPGERKRAMSPHSRVYIQHTRTPASPEQNKPPLPQSPSPRQQPPRPPTPPTLKARSPHNSNSLHSPSVLKSQSMRLAEPSHQNTSANQRQGRNSNSKFSSSFSQPRSSIDSDSNNVIGSPNGDPRYHRNSSPPSSPLHRDSKPRLPRSDYPGSHPSKASNDRKNDLDKSYIHHRQRSPTDRDVENYPPTLTCMEGQGRLEGQGHDAQLLDDNHRHQALNRNGHHPTTDRPAGGGVSGSPRQPRSRDSQNLHPSNGDVRSGMHKKPPPGPNHIEHGQYHPSNQRLGDHPNGRSGPHHDRHHSPPLSAHRKSPPQRPPSPRLNARPPRPPSPHHRNLPPRPPSPKHSQRPHRTSSPNNDLYTQRPSVLHYSSSTKRPPSPLQKCISRPPSSPNTDSLPRRPPSPHPGKRLPYSSNEPSHHPTSPHSKKRPPTPQSHFPDPPSPHPPDRTHRPPSPHPGNLVSILVSQMRTRASQENITVDDNDDTLSGSDISSDISISSDDENNVQSDDTVVNHTPPAPITVRMQERHLHPKAYTIVMGNDAYNHSDNSLTTVTSCDQEGDAGQITKHEQYCRSETEYESDMPQCGSPLTLEGQQEWASKGKKGIKVMPCQAAGPMHDLQAELSRTFKQNKSRFRTLSDDSDAHGEDEPLLKSKPGDGVTDREVPKEDPWLFGVNLLDDAPQPTNHYDSGIITNLMIQHSGQRIPQDGATEGDSGIGMSAGGYGTSRTKNVTVPTPTSFHQRGNNVGHLITHMSQQLKRGDFNPRFPSPAGYLSAGEDTDEMEAELFIQDNQSMDSLNVDKHFHHKPPSEKEMQRYALYFNYTNVGSNGKNVSGSKSSQREREKGDVTLNISEGQVEKSSLNGLSDNISNGDSYLSLERFKNMKAKGQGHLKEGNSQSAARSVGSERIVLSSDGQIYDQPKLCRRHTRLVHAANEAENIARVHVGRLAEPHSSDGDTESLYQDYRTYEKSLISYVKKDDLSALNDDIQDMYRQPLDAVSLAPFVRQGSLLRNLACCFLCAAPYNGGSVGSSRSRRTSSKQEYFFLNSGFFYRMSSGSV